VSVCHDKHRKAGAGAGPGQGRAGQGRTAQNLFFVLFLY